MWFTYSNQLGGMTAGFGFIEWINLPPPLPPLLVNSILSLCVESASSLGQVGGLTAGQLELPPPLPAPTAV